MNKIETKTLSSKVYIILKNMIAGYRFQPGERLNVERITKELGVSRTPVWEAIRRLEQEELVKNIPNRGVFMVEMDLKKALELFEIRQALEGLAGRKGAVNPDERTLGRMARILEDQGKVIEEGDITRFSKLDFDFHEQIYRTTGNPSLQEMLDSIWIKMMRPINVRIGSLLPDLYGDHIEIHKAFQSRNSGMAEQGLVQHNQRIMEHIQKEWSYLTTNGAPNLLMSPSEMVETPRLQGEGSSF